MVEGRGSIESCQFNGRELVSESAKVAAVSFSHEGGSKTPTCRVDLQPPAAPALRPRIPTARPRPIQNKPRASEPTEGGEI